MLLHSSPSFDARILEWAPSLAAGGTICLSKGSSSQQLWHSMKQLSVTHAVFTPNVLARLPQEPLPSLIYVIVVGEVCPNALMDLWSKRVTVINGYGPTETTIATHLQVYKNTHSNRYLGNSLPGVIVAVLDKKQSPVQISEIGELYIGGPGVARGYLNREKLSCQHFRLITLPSGWQTRMFRTGDLVRALPEGAIEFIERKEEMTKVNGCRIDPRFIEAEALKLPEIREVIVILVKDDEGKKILGCFYSGNVFDDSYLRQHLANQLPRYMLPSYYQRVETLPLLSNGKIDRQKLKWDHKKECTIANKKELSLLERRLLDLSSTCIEKKVVDPRTNLYSLGGDSLSAIELLISIELEWGVTILMNEFLEAPTVFALATLIRSRQEQPQKQSIIPLQLASDTPPLVLLHPASGRVDCYRTLTLGLPNQTIFGIQNPRPAYEDRAFHSLAEMVKFYAEEIEHHVPAGAIYLGGWSFGGVVALEMSRILKREILGPIILFDSFAPNCDTSKLNPKFSSRKLEKEALNNIQLLKNHRMNRIHKKVLLIRSSFSPLQDNGWSNLLTALSITEISAKHDQFFDAIHIHWLQKILSESVLYTNKLCK